MLSRALCSWMCVPSRFCLCMWLTLYRPGSFIEVRKILPPLTASSPEHPSFHVVALSLPGYGFSEASKKQSFRLAQYAEVCLFISRPDAPLTRSRSPTSSCYLSVTTNMVRLPPLWGAAPDFALPVTQGGDWGGFVSDVFC